MLRIGPGGVKVRNTRAGIFWELPLGQASVRHMGLSSEITKKEQPW
jgi:hypothetical protein